MYRVLYYPKGDSCQIIDGFSTREMAWEWVRERLKNIDWYSIEEY